MPKRTPRIPSPPRSIMDAESGHVLRVKRSGLRTKRGSFRAQLAREVKKHAHARNQISPCSFVPFLSYTVTDSRESRKNWLCLLFGLLAPPFRRARPARP